MIKNFERLYTKEDFEKIAEDNVISLQFITNYLSFDNENLNTSRVLNKYLYKINEKILWDILFLAMPKKKAFVWNYSYIGKPEKKARKEFEKKVRKLMNWSTREYDDQREIIEIVPGLKGKFARRLGLSNRERKEVGLTPIEQPKVVKLKKGTSGQKGLSVWM